MYTILTYDYNRRALTPIGCFKTKEEANIWAEGVVGSNVHWEMVSIAKPPFVTYTVTMAWERVGGRWVPESPHTIVTFIGIREIAEQDKIPTLYYYPGEEPKLLFEVVLYAESTRKAKILGENIILTSMENGWCKAPENYPSEIYDGIVGIPSGEDNETKI